MESTHIFQRQKYWARAFDGFVYAFLRCTAVMCLPIFPVVTRMQAGSNLYNIQIYHPRTPHCPRQSPLCPLLSA